MVIVIVHNPQIHIHCMPILTTYTPPSPSPPNETSHKQDEISILRCQRRTETVMEERCVEAFREGFVSIQSLHGVSC